jgi:hypothetical protein
MNQVAEPVSADMPRPHPYHGHALPSSSKTARRRLPLCTDHKRRLLKVNGVPAADRRGVTGERTAPQSWAQGRLVCAAGYSGWSRRSSTS